MNWIQPKFSSQESQEKVQPKKRQKLDKTFTEFGVIKPNNCYSYSISDPFQKGVSWIEKYRPSSRNELVVHKKKIEDVGSWLQSLSNEDANVLLITGPPGCGKLTTLKVLCKELKVQVSEWITPLSYDFDPHNFNGAYCSQQKTFEDFLIRASRYSSVISSSPCRRVVVVKDIPNVLLQSSSSFHDLLLKFSKCQELCVVFILTDNSIIKELFPETIKSSVNITTINFNPFTKKSIHSVLSNIIKKEKLSASFESSVIDDISNTCDGDLRNAIMTLNFMNSKDSRCNYPGKKSKSKSNFSKVSSSLTKQYLCDPSIDIFHGLGRVLYIKRNSDGTPVYDPNTIVDSFSTCTNNFINMLQENYLNIFSDINSVSRASSYLATSDFIFNDNRDSLTSKDLSLSIAIRGLMYTNKNPVKKFQQLGKSKISKVNEFSKSYSNSVKANFFLSNPSTILLDSVTYLNKMSNILDSDSQKKLIKELSCYYLMDKNI